MTRGDEDLHYRGPIAQPSVAPAKTPVKDEQDYSTLRTVHKELGNALTQLHGFNAFDLTETELKIKQQIKAHQIAADIITPLFELVSESLAVVDGKYRS